MKSKKKNAGGLFLMVNRFVSTTVLILQNADDAGVGLSLSAYINSRFIRR